ncbi:hypothetical protein B296_00023889 [Ensete ventricosum]|uniref:Uncharacterized protein n=1 Tax=Ensete ventricosum TaxID=4639 RepID=A0A426ZDG5_ENSVE|nr:hypothetical protein B296_00023889 [Ensete ventricosum]
MTTSWQDEAVEVPIDSGGSCGPLPRWWRELHTEATMGMNHTRMLVCRTRSLTTKEASMLCDSCRGNNKGSVDGRGKSCARVYGLGSHRDARGGFYEDSKRK